MVLIGLAITLLGFFVAVFSLGITTSVSGRLVVVMIGLAMSLFGIIGVLNRAYLKNAIWKR